MSRVSFVPVVLVLASSPVVLMAQGPPSAQTAVAPQTAGERYTRVTALADIPADQMNVTMHLMQAQLGVNCQYCHVDEQFDREDNAMKQVARRMIEITRDANRTGFGGAPVVTCYTCHRGHPKPEATPVLPVADPRRPASVDRPALPSAAAIFQRYVQALGGERALQRVTTRVMTGRRDMPSGPGGVIPVPTRVEIVQKAPDLVAATYTGERVVLADGFDGRVAWQRNAAGVVTNLPMPEQQRVGRASSMTQPLHLGQEYVRTDVSATTFAGRPAYLVTGYPDGDELEHLTFDAESGLLLRRATRLPTPIGVIPLEVSYDDYRITPGGVRIPFVVRYTPASLRSELSTSSTLRIDDVREGVPVDDARLARPQSSSPGPRPR